MDRSSAARRSAPRPAPSPQGVLWTAAALPAAWSGYGGTNNPEIGCASGRAVGLFCDPDPVLNSQIRVITSTDGTTWTGVTLASGIAFAAFTAPRITRPTYDAARCLWFFCVSSVTTDKAEVWTSRDGTTWTIAHTFTSKVVEAQATCLIGPVWAMLTTKGRIMTSKDAGVSWRVVANLDGTANEWAMAFGGGGALILNSADQTCFAGTRGGRTVGAAI